MQDLKKIGDSFFSYEEMYDNQDLVIYSLGMYFGVSYMLNFKP